MPADEFRGLAEVYPTALRRRGQVYPAVVQPWPVRGFEPPVVIEQAREPAPRCDRQIRDEAYLQSRLRADPLLTNGPTVCWESGVAGRVHTTPGRYFDMIASCGALRDEVARSGDYRDWAQNPLRAAIHDLTGDPLRNGAARSAAVGVSVIVTVPCDGGRALVIGQRPGNPARGGGRWHVAPSGMLEWDDTGSHLTATVLRELGEELGIQLAPDEVGERMTVLGMAQDLTMLRPDIVVRLDLGQSQVPSDLRPVSEFTRLDLVPLTGPGFVRFWESHPPESLLPHAAGAIAIVEMLAGG